MAARKTPPPLSPRPTPPTPAERAFVEAAPAEGSPAVVSHHESPSLTTSHAATAPRGRQVQASGRVVRRVTIYLPAELGDRLEAHCQREDRDLSWAVARALEAWLSTRD